jgi:acylphosphatase
MSATQRMLVSGKVQGVGYRNWTIHNAKALGVTGWVRNVQDGRVEIMASGDHKALEALVEACREGPRLARVDHVEVQSVEDARLKGFNKRFGV